MEDASIPSLKWLSHNRVFYKSKYSNIYHSHKVITIQCTSKCPPCNSMTLFNLLYIFMRKSFYNDRMNGYLQALLQPLDCYLVAGVFPLLALSYSLIWKARICDSTHLNIWEKFSNFKYHIGGFHNSNCFMHKHNHCPSNLNIILFVYSNPSKFQRDSTYKPWDITF